MKKFVAAHQVDGVDQEKEIKILIELFTKEVRPDYNASSNAVVVQALNLNALNIVSNTVHPNTSTNALLPPPSPFVRRKRQLQQVPVGPSFVEVDEMPIECKALSHQRDEPPDEYSVVLGFLMGL